MNKNGKAKIIRKKDCKDLAELEQNYAGLWRALGWKVTKKKNSFILRSKCHTYMIGAGDAI
tara:strand:- start:401 stop:583 length:183 start_codon:yes stop_codon:yes gene_type:complete